MPKTDWQPTASLAALKQRAQLYRQLRSFFLARNILEVEVPVLGEAATVDPHIDSLYTRVLGQTRYLQTSPEFFLKRLLAAGSGDIYTLGKVFRQGEQGKRHQPEFTMLEWYRTGWDEQQLMDEVAELVTGLLPDTRVSRFCYRELFDRYLGINPHQADLETLSKVASQHLDLSPSFTLDNKDNRDSWLDLLISHCIEPRLPPGLVFVYDYPGSQAALAKTVTNIDGDTIAKRFEAYLGGIEIANGYHELTDAGEQQRRFTADRDWKRQHRQQDLPYDQKMVSALEAGMPDCAGVALGIDRLLMKMMGRDNIREVISFA